MTVLEEWRRVPDWPEYEVSDLARVRRIAKGGGAKVGRILKSWLTLGYPYVSLWRGNRKTSVAVHRLVAAAFLPTPGPGQYQVAHRDGVRTDSRPSNLRWATPVENAGDRHEHGTHAIGAANPGAKLTVQDVIAIRNLRGTHQFIADQFGVTRQTVGDIINRRRWGHVQ